MTFCSRHLLRTFRFCRRLLGSAVAFRELNSDLSALEYKMDAVQAVAVTTAATPGSRPPLRRRPGTARLTFQLNPNVQVDMSAPASQQPHLNKESLHSGNKQTPQSEHAHREHVINLQVDLQTRVQMGREICSTMLSKEPSSASDNQPSKENTEHQQATKLNRCEDASGILHV